MRHRHALHTAGKLAALVLLPLFASCSIAAGSANQGRRAVPAPTTDAAPAAQSGSARAVFAGGCFWGMQWVFEHVPGVSNVTSGFAGGSAAHPSYEQVSTGDTGYAETVQIDYDPSKVSYGQLLRVYFSVATDPTELNRQGPDTGTQYRGVIFYTTPEQQRIARDYIAQLTAAHAFAAPIVTQVVPFAAFHRAEDYHQDYARLHPDAPYIAINDAPKVVALQRELPTLYRATPAVWHDSAAKAIMVDVR